ncbi:hypothetical protein D3C81_530480 [compost metagenome]
MGGGFGHQAFFDLGLFKEAIVAFGGAVQRDITPGTHRHVTAGLGLGGVKGRVPSGLNARVATAGDFSALLAYGLIHPLLATAVAFLIFPALLSIEVNVTPGAEFNVVIRHQRRRLRIQIATGLQLQIPTAGEGAARRTAADVFATVGFLTAPLLGGVQIDVTSGC